MRRIAALAFVLGSIGIADVDAEPTRKVTIRTNPAGAVVYLQEKEAGPACQPTPCAIDAPVGETPIIIELAGHQQVFEMLIVPRRGKIKVPVFRLMRAVATIIIDGPRGARVRIDDIVRGKAPLHAEVSADGHHVVVELNGKTLYDDFIEVSSGEEKRIPVQRGRGAAQPKPDDEDEDKGDPGDDDSDDSRDTGDSDDDDPLADARGRGGDDDDSNDDADARGTTPAAASVRSQYVRASVALDVGFRRFTYAGVETPQTLREESENGQLLGGPVIEVWPGALAKVRALRGLSLLGRIQLGLNSQPVAGAGIMNQLSTFWQSMELSVRHGWTIGELLTLELGAGYVRDQFQFEGTASDILLVPDVDYQALRLGARASLRLGRFEPYITGEPRFVTSSGRVQVRFRETSTSGLRGAVGVDARHGKLVGRLEASLTRYSWDFTFDSADMLRADGASDSIKKLQLVVGYEY